MPLNTIRVDLCGLSPDVVKDHIIDGIHSIHQRKDVLYDYHFYIQLEEGDETGKLHWQGWVDHNTPVCGGKDPRDAFRERMNKWVNSLDGLFKKSSSKSFAKIKDFVKIHSYHLNNPSKIIDDENIFTNYSSEELEGFKDNCPVWHIPSKKKDAIKSDWFSVTLKELEGFAIFTDLKGEKRINYSVIPQFVLHRVPKNLDYIIFTRLVMGLTNNLECKYLSKFNKRIRDNFLDKFMNDFPDIFKVSNFN